VANSEATKKTLVQSAPWLNPAHIRVIYNGIDVARFDPENTQDLRSALSLKPEHRLAGFVGRLNVQKGIQNLLEAFYTASKNDDLLHLLIVGEGDLLESIQIFAREHHLQQRCHLLGFREDIPDIMRTIDYLVLPSLWEGFGIVLIEAMAAGKPCITTNVSSMPEIVQDGVSGIVVPSNDNEALAHAMMSMQDRQALTMGKEGRKIVEHKFQIDDMVDAYEALFEDLVKSG
jgi:glycosyltransferase involved in cell wall biosynthesis